jgi:hypothetical protein
MQAKDTYSSHQQTAKIGSAVALTNPEPIHITIALALLNKLLNR